jgi:ABC-type microcin C transport system duplicated ATPase subunit YejF
MNDAVPILELRNVTVRLGGSRSLLWRTIPPVVAVNAVSLSLWRGEVLALVGESGSGKTTLGRAVLGLQRESEGEILLEGRSVGGTTAEQARRVRRAIQYVHQDAAAALDPWWSIGRTLEEGLIVHGLRSARERRDRVTRMLQAVGLDPAARHRYPHEFSGGQLRRVALARILLLEPRVLILDEPTSGLDMSVQATVLNLLLADRVAIMRDGRIVELAPTPQVFAQPQHPYTQALLAAAPRLHRRITPAVVAERNSATAGAA